MNSYQVQASAVVHAPADVVYAVIADYRNGHPKILPAYFSNLVVEEGGVGAGTRIRFEITVMGKKQSFRADISEPQPGRVLVETNDAMGGSITTFTVEPTGNHARVTISTEVKKRGGLGGMIAQLMTSMFLRRVYGQELQLLDEVAKAWKS
ncbi:MAG: SRPBCC family protein [Caldilineaceae bacterium]